MSETWTSPLRAYRRQCRSRPNERVLNAAVDETDLRISLTLPAEHERLLHASGQDDELLDLVLAAIREARAQVLNWCLLEPTFRTSLSPLPLPAAAPELVLAMYRAALRTGVGPFAAVAGTIAQYVATRLAVQLTRQIADQIGAPATVQIVGQKADQTSKQPYSVDLLVENGGDVYLISQHDRIVGLLPDPATGLLIGIKLPATACPVALCASSGKIGHSLSFGVGDLAVICAGDAALADAAATACANMLRTADDVPRMIERARNLPGVTGAFAQCAGRIGLWGMELAEHPIT